MSSQKTTLEKLITNGNYQKLQSYLAKHPEVISDEDFYLASQKFLDSTNHDISNRYSIIKLLTPKASPEALAQLKKEADYPKKYAEYTEQQTHRHLLKSLDSIIEKDFIYPIKYPEKTSFIRKLLRLAPKRKAHDILENFRTELPNVIDKLKYNIEKNEKFQDAYRNLIISPEQLNSLVYERISLKASKQLHLDRSVVDEAFKDRNQNKLKEIEDVVYTFSQLKQAQAVEKFPDTTRSVENNIKSLVPPHLSNWTDVGAAMHILNAKAKMPQKALLHSVIKDALNIRVTSLANQMHDQQAKNLHLESVNTLRSLIDIEQNVVDYGFKYAGQLEAVQGKLYDKLWDDQKGIQHLPSSSLREFERCGIALMQQSADPDQKLNISEQKLLTNFIEYATDNSEVNARYGRILKKNDLSKNDLANIRKIHKYSHKTFEMGKIRDATDKLDKMMSEYEQNPTAQFTEEQKVPLHDIGYLYKFNDSTDVIDVLNLVRDGQVSDTLQHHIELSEKSGALWQNMMKILGEEMLVRDGELVMSVSKDNYAATHHSRDMYTKLKDMVTSYNHAAVGITTPTQSASTVSHITKDYTTDEISGVSTLYNEVLHIRPDKLLNPKLRKAVEGSTGLSGETLDDYLDKEYARIAQDLHSTENFTDTKITHSIKRQNDSGVADFVPFGHRGKQKVKSWAQKVLSEQEQGAPLGQVLASETNGEMICSEFAAKMTVLTLQKLDQELTTQILKHDPTFKPPPEGIIKLPFGPKEDLSKVSPERLVKQLQKVNAIEKVEPKGLAQAAIRR